MELVIQLKVLIVSFIYGILVSYVLRSQYKYFFNTSEPGSSNFILESGCSE